MVVARRERRVRDLVGSPRGLQGAEGNKLQTSERSDLGPAESTQLKPKLAVTSVLMSWCVAASLGPLTLPSPLRV